MQNAAMNTLPPTLQPDEIRDLFVNKDPVATWDKSIRIIRSISPNFELQGVRTVFEDVLRLFDGSYPEYSPIKTPYHDLQHTLDVFICAVRLLHGVHLDDTRLSDDEIALIMIAALLHDCGYAQKTHEAKGSGAQYTRTHIRRGIEFMAKNLSKWKLPAAWGISLEAIIQCTDMNRDLSKINFPDERIHLCGQIVGSADLVGQMADRIYLEKLLLLYLEFKEADLGIYENIHDLLQKTPAFYEYIRQILDGELGGVYRSLNFHFKNEVNIDRNFYLESIKRNIEYLDKVIALNKVEWLDMLKRHGIVKNIQTTIAPSNHP